MTQHPTLALAASLRLVEEGRWRELPVKGQRQIGLVSVCLHSPLPSLNSSLGNS